ncbi:TPA: DNA-binding protein [Yersinia enterocolitica]|nr:DNA-binding protein [Yersinia enterocolitica]HDL6901027.1 DNA-binding protein [Yersinia enterocolitica]HDL7092133.1 DNA-binding protein [Yersinia enterocolitica]HDL7101171.1 DNA-binding protein [Yersinia enterocolitica]HDL7135652.1 DNA-binding protein [Yersinia enterocolitica]
MNEQRKKLAQSLIAFVKEIQKVEPNRAKRTDGGFHIDPRLIQIDPNFNTRAEGFDSFDEFVALEENRAYINRLKKAYKEGILPPPALVVQVIDGILYLRDGNCRLYAIRELISEGTDISLVPVNENKGDEEKQDMLILASQDGLKVTALAHARVYQRMMSHGWDEKRLAIWRDCTVNQIKNTLELLNFPKRLKYFVAANITSWTHTLELYRAHGAEKAIQQIEAVLNAKQIEAAKRQEKLIEDSNNNTTLPQNSENDENGNGQNNSPDGTQPKQQRRALIKPSDLKPKRLPKGMVDKVHDSVSKLTFLTNDDNIIAEEGASEVQVVIPLAEFEMLREMKAMLDKFDEENLKALGVVTESDPSVPPVDVSQQESNESEQAQQTSANAA